MKVFRVWVDNCDYNEYDSFVVVAESEEEIRKKFKYEDRYWWRYEYRLGEDLITFTATQVKTLDDIHIEEVDLTKESIVCSSFNAG